MKQQNEWFTGIDYFQNPKEKEVHIEYQKLQQDIGLQQHMQVKIWYVLEGEAEVFVNGSSYKVSSNSLFCMFAHHFYEIKLISTSVDVYIVSFYIGLFLHMMWEKHPKGMHAQLVYHIQPVIDASCDSRFLNSFHDLYRESTMQEFGSKNLMMYQVLQIYTLYCRYVLRQEKIQNQPKIWEIIERVFLSPGKDFTLFEVAQELNYHPTYCNLKWKQLTNYSFAELVEISKIINACALLHFEQLNISYIIDQLGFTSSATFYRWFEKKTGKDPITYQKQHILDCENLYIRQELWLQVMQYLFMHFSSPITMEIVCRDLKITMYELKKMCQEYEIHFSKLLQQIRLHFASLLLKLTTNTVTTIAITCGFSSSNSFQRSFYQVYQMTPSQYRKQANILKNEKF